MDKEEQQTFARAIEANVLKSAQEEKFPLWRRSHWDEWGSPVGLSIGWALLIVPLGSISLSPAFSRIDQIGLKRRHSAVFLVYPTFAR